MKNNNTNLKKEKDMKKICTRKEDFSKWYSDIINVAELAEHAPVRGCMIIKPYGYEIWENIQKVLDDLIKSVGVKNAYFPLFIPESFLKREAEHVEGFSPELAVVTTAGGKKLEEPLVVRPTSETIIYDAFSRWINSYRDLPLLINQWANVVRWEMRPRLFLRTTEFLWQEGHTAHATAQDAKDFTLKILNEVYAKFAEEYLAIPVYTGVKSESEKFAGAHRTYCIEALMQDGKSLQTGTSHDLSNNFAKPFNVKYLNDKGEQDYVFQTSWGVSTRLIGGLIMSHGDDNGLIVPPKVAPIQIVIIPIAKSKEEKSVLVAHDVNALLSESHRVYVDDRTIRPGEKYFEWEKKGVPLRVEIGPKDLEKNSCILARRDTGEKTSCLLENIKTEADKLLQEIQTCLFEKAKSRRDSTNRNVDDWDIFEEEIQKGGYIFSHWCEDAECEAKIKKKTKSVTRCLRFDQPKEAGKHGCVHCGKETKGRRWMFAKAY